MASGATGVWAGWDLNVAYYVDGAWIRLVPKAGLAGLGGRRGKLPRLERQGLECRGTAGLRPRRGLPARARRRRDRRAVFDFAAIAAGADRSYALPNVSSELASLAGAQTFDGAKTFAGALDASGPVATIGTAPGTATYGVGTGATASGATKTVNLGTGGAAGSDTVVNVGSDMPGADGRR